MKHFIKLTAVLFVMMLALGLAGCTVEVTETSTAEPGKEITNIDELFTDTFPNRMSTSPSEDDEEKVWKGLFTTSEAPHAGYLVKAKLSDDEFEAMEATTYADEDHDEKVHEILKGCKELEITNISDRIPTQEELDKLYKGKAFGDLETEGFNKSGHTSDEEGHYSFYYDGPEYYVKVTPPADIIIEDMDDYSENDIRKLTIDTIEFMGLSGNILDE